MWISMESLAVTGFAFMWLLFPKIGKPIIVHKWDYAYIFTEQAAMFLLQLCLGILLWLLLCLIVHSWRSAWKDIQDVIDNKP